MGVHKASVIDACECVTKLCEAISCIDGSAMWGSWADKPGYFPTRPALWETLEATINAFYEKGVTLEDLNEAIKEAGWDDNCLQIFPNGKVRIV